MFRSLHLFLAFVLALALFAVATPQAHAGYGTIIKTMTIATGTSITTAAIPMRNVKIRDVVVLAPTFDSGDTGLIKLTCSALGATYVPNGWSDKAIGATEDGAYVKCNTSELSIISPDAVIMRLGTSTPQIAARTWQVVFLFED